MQFEDLKERKKERNKKTQIKHEKDNSIRSTLIYSSEICAVTKDQNRDQQMRDF